MEITVFSHRTRAIGRRVSLTWDGFCRAMTYHATRHAPRKEALRQFSPATFEGNRRKKRLAQAISMAVLDVDNNNKEISSGNLALSIEDAMRALQGWNYLIYTTWSHHPGISRPRFRICVPFTEPIPPAHFKGTMWHLARELFMNQAGEVHLGIDPAGLTNYALPYYLPANGAIVTVGTGLDWTPGHYTFTEDEDDHPAGGQYSSPCWLNRMAATKYTSVIIQEVARRVAGAVKGDRNNALNRGAYSLGRAVGAGLIPEAEATDLLVSMAEHVGLVRDDGMTSVLNTIRSGLEAGKARPLHTRRLNVEHIFK